MKVRITFEREVADKKEAHEWAMAVSAKVHRDDSFETPDDYFYEYVDDE